MANDFAAIGSALYSTLSAGSVSVYYGVAPQGAVPPYCTFSRQSGLDEYTFTDSGVTTDYVVKVFSNRVWPGEAILTYGTIHALLNNKQLSLAGFTGLRCRRMTTIEFRDPEGFWNVGGVYRIDVWQS